MTLSLPTATRNAAADAVGNLANSGTLKLYTGSKPSDPNTAATGTLLATFNLAADAFAAAASGQAALSGTPISATAAASGTAGWFRVADSGGATVFDGAVGGDLTLNSTSITSGGTVTINSGSITMPA